MNHPTSDSVPSYPSAALGYRVWELKKGMLKPLHQGPSWRPGMNLAYCIHKNHVAPADECHCGFNAYHRISDAISEAERAWNDDYRNAERSRTLMIGAIAGAGDLRIHHAGFRCERAQILGVYPFLPSKKERIFIKRLFTQMKKSS